MPAAKKHASLLRRGRGASTRAVLTRVEHDTTTADAYTALTVAQLRTEIQRRNLDGRKPDHRMTTTGRKADLVDRLLADDSPIPPAPPIPDHPRGRPWHPMALDWWADVWASPMSLEWDTSDVHNVVVCALLFDDSITAEKETARRAAAAELRLQKAELGLSPYSRRRLEWSIETAADAKARGEQRRNRSHAPPPAQSTARQDPRGHFANEPQT